MPEANVLRLTADRLGEALIGSPLIRAELRWPSVAGANLVGASVVENVSLGKHLLTRLDTGQTLHTHLRMDGFWRLARTGSRAASGIDPQIRAVLATEDWTALGWHLGMMDLVATRDEGVLIGHLGPDILHAGFTDSTAPDGGLIEAVRRIYDLERSPDGADLTRSAAARPVCAVLLDQRVVAGIGTIFMSDSLYETGTWPWIPVSQLPPARAGRILATAARQLHRSINTAKTRGMRLATRKVHGQHGKFCPKCNSEILVGSLSGPDIPPDQGTGNRIVFYCPGCQPPTNV
jgi:endonuclease VIII